MNKNRIPLILVGGGGHCKSCIDVIELEGKYEIKGIVDLKEKVGENVCGYKIIGTDEDLEDLSKEYRHFLITLGHMGNPDKRIRLYTLLKNFSVIFPNIISPLAHVSRYSFIEEGTIVMHGAIVNAGAKVGVNSIINTKALIEHDVKIGSHCHISTGAIVNGNSEVGDFTFIGSGAIVSNGVSIKEKTIIGAGSVVVKDIKESGVYVGNPARRIR